MLAININPEFETNIKINKKIKIKTGYVIEVVVDI
jgi:hypothetical protein